MYVDDVYYSTLTGTIFDLLDLERVEILRGPQGTLAGKNSIGGAVKLFSKRPTGDGSGSLSVTYGQYNRVDVRGTGDFALVPDKLLMRVSGVTKQRDGYFDVLDYGCLNPGSGVTPRNNTSDCKLAEQSGVDYSGARASLLWVVSDDVDVLLIGDYTHDNSSPPGNVLRYANNANPSTSQFPGVVYDSRFVPGGEAYYNTSSFNVTDSTFTGPLGSAPIDGLNLSSDSEFQGWGASAQIDWRMSDSFSLSSITAYRNYESKWSTDGDYSPLQVTLGHDEVDHWQFSQELRLNGTAGPLDYTFGAYYFDQKTTYRTHQLILYVPVFPLDFLGDDPVAADTQAAFAHAVWHVTDRLSLTAGARYTEESKDYTFHRRNRDGTPHSIPWTVVPPPFVGGAAFGSLGALDGVTASYEGSKTDYRASLDYKWTDSFMTYLQVATGFKGGGIGPRPFAPDQARPFGPEEVTAYEFGVKSTLLDGRMRMNASVFFNDYKDIQLTFLNCASVSVVASPCALPQNAGDAEIQGAELEIEMQLAGALSVDAAVSYLDFEYTRINPNAGGPTQPAGVQLDMIAPFTPEMKASAGVQYTFDLGDAGSLTPRVDAAFQDEMYSNAVNGPYNFIESRTLANARLTWSSADDSTSVSAEVTNLAGKYYDVSTFDLSGAAGIATAQPGAPRMWAVTIRKSF